MQLSEKRRYEIIIRHDNKQSSRKISKEMNINRKTVLHWIKIYNETNNVLSKNKKINK